MKGRISSLNPNPVLKKLGLSDEARVVIFHADDIGMCQASLSAYADLVEVGIISAASTMVPCPWFPATAAFCRTNPDRVDMGVHITLTSEWDNYRWGPISTHDSASGLLDAEGYLHRGRSAMVAQGQPEAVAREIEAQVQRALDAGIDITHIDTHMGTVFHPKFLEAYIQIALKHRVPPMLVRQNVSDLQDRHNLQEMNIDAEGLAQLIQSFQTLEARGVPMLDDVQGIALDPAPTVVGAPTTFDVGDCIAQIRRTLKTLTPGLTYLILHPSTDTPELRMITGNWRRRVADYQTFANPALRDVIEAEGVHVVGWRILRDLMRDAM